MTKLCVPVFIVGLFLSSLVAAEVFKEGEDYERLATPVRLPANGQVIVMEFFWYGCSHCASLEGEVQGWLRHRPEDVVFLGVAAPINPQWRVHARAFYIAQALGVHRQLHGPLFATLADNPRAYLDDRAMAGLFATHGVSSKAYLDLASSPKISQAVDRALRLAKAVGVEYVPQFLVGGRYRTSPSLAGGNKESIDVLRFLIDKVRQEAASK